MKVRACPFLTTYMLVFPVNTLLLGHGRIATPGVYLSFDSKRFFPFLGQRVLELLARVKQFWLFFFVFLINLFILVVLGVRYGTRAFSGYGEQGLLFIVEHVVWAHGLR